MVFKRLVYILMTVLVLLADSGQTIYARTCLKTNHTSFALTQVTCCHKKAVAKDACSFKRPSCCKVSVVMAKQVLPAQVQAGNTLKASVPVLFAVQIFKVSIPQQSVNANYTFGSTPEPPLSACIEFTKVFRC